MDQRHSLGPLFFFDRRLNVPFFFSLFLLFVNLFLLFRIVGRKKKGSPETKFWITILITFLLFTLDEAFYIHQHFKMSTFGTIASYDQSSWTHYLWVLPYFLVFGILFVRIFMFSFTINRATAKKLFTAAFVFLLGAVVMEFAGTFYAVANPADFWLLTIKTLEGTLQMLGAILFIHALYGESNDSNQMLHR